MGLVVPSRDTSGPALGSRAVTPSDTVDIVGGPARALWVVVAGNLSFVDAEGNTVNLTAVPAFTVVPVAATRVRATGTTATVRTLD